MNERAEMQVFDNANFGTLRTTDQRRYANESEVIEV